MNSFKTIDRECSFELKEKGSKFIAFGFPIDNESDVKIHLQELKLKFPDATHHCYAFKLGEKYRTNDDGEPGNSAGLPIYRQILSSGLDYLLVVVVRYFGGKKLGIPGLIKSYGEATKICLNMAEKIEKTQVIKYHITCMQNEEYKIYELSSRLGLTPEVTESGYILSIESKIESMFKELCNNYANLYVNLLEDK